MRIGLDVGSTTLKCVVVNEAGKLLFDAYERHFGKTAEKAAELLEEKRDVMEFCSIEEIKKECKISQSVLDVMREMGSLGDLPAKAQLSIFDAFGM